MLFNLRLIILPALLLLPLFMLGLFNAVLHIEHLIQLFPKGIVLRCSDRFLLPQGGLFLLPARYVDFLHTMLFLQDALGGIIQVDLILMVSPELFSSTFPMDTVHLINDGLDAADMFSKSNHVIQLLDLGSTGLGLGHKSINGS